MLGCAGMFTRRAPCRLACELARSKARTASTKAWMRAGSFRPGRAFDARGDIDARRARRLRAPPRRSSSSRPPERNHGFGEAKSVQERPVEGRRRGRPAGWRRAAAWRRGAGGPSDSSAMRGEIAARGDADRLHHRHAGHGADRAHALRRLLAVQLQEIGPERLGDRAKSASSPSTVTATICALPRARVGERRGPLQRDVPRARRKEHESDEIGARFKRGVDAFLVGKPADFDLCRHAGSVARNARKSRIRGAGLWNRRRARVCY